VSTGHAFVFEGGPMRLLKTHRALAAFGAPFALAALSAMATSTALAAGDWRCLFKTANTLELQKDVCRAANSATLRAGKYTCTLPNTFAANCSQIYSGKLAAGSTQTTPKKSAAALTSKTTTDKAATDKTAAAKASGKASATGTGDSAPLRTAKEMADSQNLDRDQGNAGKLETTKVVPLKGPFDKAPAASQSQAANGASGGSGGSNSPSAPSAQSSNTEAQAIADKGSADFTKYWNAKNGKPAPASAKGGGAGTPASAPSAPSAPAAAKAPSAPTPQSTTAANSPAPSEGTAETPPAAETPAAGTPTAATPAAANGGGGGGASAPSGSVATHPSDTVRSGDKYNYRNDVGDDECAVSEKLGHGCRATRATIEGGKVTNAVTQLAGSVTTAAVGQNAQMEAQSKGTQSATLEAAARTSKTSGQIQISTGALNAAVGAMQLYMSVNHNKGSKAIAKGGEQGNFQSNTALDATRKYEDQQGEKITEGSHGYVSAKQGTMSEQILNKFQVRQGSNVV
jgi:hypothetical protein